MKEFVEAWKQKFHDEKYSKTFYSQSLKNIKESKNNEQLGQLIILMLHWKDGKVYEDPSGSLKILNKNYSIGNPKPFTYNSSIHKPILLSQEFFEFALEMIASDSFDEKNVKRLSEFKLWKESAIVIPAFVLHTLSPKIYPLYDQHVERAMRTLLAQELNEKPNSLTLETYIQYKQFFESFLQTIYPDHQPNLEEIKAVDDALWSFGKWLKPKRKTEKTFTYNSDNSVISYDMKVDVLTYIDRGMTQRQAMETVANEHNLVLKESYYLYPGSHIYRWKKKGIRGKQ
ncbi:hypothetical protein [Metabacillus endolithicus]|uniref:Uncharacterized protein n=1 Tax=Metabacillus endolithicus TaxID=1535204 RepID=A0ABW5BRX6_9BACI|nr:hypothetical protein [Metabacillus endolithicus]UPG63666.1 hypothetical protein MVE64_00310 [Metabacillus endolithicus]